MPKKSINKVHTKVSTERTDNGANLYKQFKSIGFESVFEILQISKPRFIQLYNEKLKGNAGKVYDWAMFYINYIAHHYRGNEGTAPKLQADEPLTSDSAMAYSVAYAYAAPPLGSEELKPTYEHLFPEDKDIPVCHPESLKAQTSPVAYLVALYQFVNNLGKTEEGETVAKPIKELFEQRRPDIPLLCLNEKNTNQAISGLELVNDILATAIKKKLGDAIPKDQTLDEFLAYTVYPFELPFYLPYLQILQVLEEKKLALGAIIQQVNPKYPYYLDAKLGFDDIGFSVNANRDLKAYSGLTPTQMIAIASLTIPSSVLDSENFPLSAYLIEYYGLYRNKAVTEGIKALLAKLKSGQVLTPPEIAQLQACIPQLLEDLTQVTIFLEQTSLTRDNLNQLFSLQQYQPKVSKNFIKKGNGEVVKPPTPADYGSIHINAYGRSLLGIDGQPPDEKIINRSSTNLSDDFYLINQFIRFQAWTGIKSNELDWLIYSAKSSLRDDEFGIMEKPIWTTIRAFGFFRYLYASYVITLEEFTGVIYTLCPYSIGDALSQFDRLFNANEDVPALILDNSAFNYQSGDVADQQTMHQIATGLLIDYQVLQRLAALLIEGTYLDKLTRSLETISAFYRLTKLAQLFGFGVLEFWQLLNLVVKELEIKKQFLVPELVQEGKPDTLNVIVALEQAVVWLKKHHLTPVHLLMLLGTENPTLVATPQAMNLFNDLKQFLEMGGEKTEAEVTAALSQALIKLYHVAPDLAFNLVQWIGKDFAISILAEVDALKDEVTDVASLQAKGGAFLNKVYDLERHVASSNFLKLTKTELQLLNSHPEYFPSQVSAGEPAKLDFKLLYLLTRLKDWLALSTETEEKLLSYFTFAHTQPVDKQHCIDLLAESMHWDKREIEFLFDRLDNPTKVAKTMSDIDWILRIKELCMQTGLPANQLIALATLGSASSKGLDSPYVKFVEAANALLATRKVVVPLSE